MIRSRAAGVALTALALATACGRGVDGARTAASPTISGATSRAELGSPPAPSETAISSPPATSGTGSTRELDSLPILALEYDCYGACVYLWPLGLSEVAVYADGSVAIARDGPPEATATSGAIRTYSLKLTDKEVESLRTAAHDVGLQGGGVHAAGTTANTADGGGSIFFGRDGGLVTVIEAPFLWDGEDFSHGDRKQRAALLSFQKQLASLEKRSDAKPVAPDGYVALIGPAEDAGIGRTDPKPWPGPNALASYQDVVGSRRCAVIPAADATPAMVDALTTLTYGATYTSQGATWSVEGRPLMPHQKTCADVASWQRLLAADERAKLVGARK
ncbi:MAG: hypothetical protein ABI912_03570 [Actinomycetota bacterium]